MLVQDNQQATIGWFVGILEGEGNFDKREYNYYRIKITNTDLDIIKNCESFLIKSNILFSRTEQKHNNKNWKKYYNILISSKECDNLYRVIESKLECRRQQFQQMIGVSEILRDTSLDLDWLIGIWQAEGTFYITQNQKNCMIPYTSLENTNYKIIDKIVKNLQHLGCSWYCKEFLPTTPNRKPYIRISIAGLKRCLRFLNQTKNRWLSQRDLKRTNLMLEHINSRLLKPQGVPYSDREHQIYLSLKQLNV